jgi:hypothetical protein
MEAIAKALIIAVQYIADRGEENTLDDDVRALEDAASIVGKATLEEKEMLRRVACDLGLPNWPEEIGIGQM